MAWILYVFFLWRIKYISLNHINFLLCHCFEAITIKFWRKPSIPAPIVVYRTVVTPDEKLTLNILITATREIDFFFLPHHCLLARDSPFWKKLILPPWLKCNDADFKKDKPTECFQTSINDRHRFWVQYVHDASLYFQTPATDTKATQNWSINIQHITIKLSTVSLFPSLWLTAPSVHPSINSLFHAAPDANHREAEHQQSPICTGSKQVLLPDATDTTRHSHPRPSQSCQYLQGKDTSNILQMGCNT